MNFRGQNLPLEVGQCIINGGQFSSVHIHFCSILPNYNIPSRITSVITCPTTHKTQPKNLNVTTSLAPMMAIKFVLDARPFTTVRNKAKKHHWKQIHKKECRQPNSTDAETTKAPPSDNKSASNSTEPELPKIPPV